MPELNGEAFLPPFCPALNAVMGKKERPKQGTAIRPAWLYINFLDLDHSTYGAAGVDVDVYFCMPDESDHTCADITQEISPIDPRSEEGRNVAWLSELDDVSFDAVERAVGERYCERVKQCGGVILRGDKPVCQGLDPDAFQPMISELRRGAE